MNIIRCATPLVVMLTVLCQAVPACDRQDILMDDDNPMHTMSSPNFPQKYPPSVRCEFLYRASPGYRVQFQFTTFTLESARNGVCDLDFLEIFDGMDENSSKLETLCGKETPPNVTSSDSYLLAVFSTDEQIEFEGFEAFVTIVQYDPREPLPTIPPGNYGGQLRHSGGAIYSPGFPNPYTGNQHCTYILSIPDLTQHILMRFAIFELKPSNNSMCVRDQDYIEVRDGLRPNSTLIGTYCGSNMYQPEDLIIESTGPVMYVYYHFNMNPSFETRFFADYTSSEIGFPGKSVEEGDDDDENTNYISVCDCSYAPMSNRGGVIVSQQSYPDGTYQVGRICTIEFLALQPDHRIFLNLRRMDIPHQHSCDDGGDFLSINDGNQTNPNNLATLCREIIRAKYTSSSYYAEVIFVSDNTQNEDYAGFKLIYSTYYEASPTCYDDDYKCSNDRCIDQSLKCDGNDHCGDASDELQHVCTKTNFIPGVVATSIVCLIALIIICCCASHHEKEQKRMGIHPVLRNAEDEMEDEGVTTMEYLDSETGNPPRSPGSTTGLPRSDPINAISGTLTTNTTNVKVDVDMQRAAYVAANTPGTSKKTEELQRLYPMFLASGLIAGSKLEIGSKCTFLPRDREEPDEAYTNTDNNANGDHDEPNQRTTSPIAWPEHSRSKTTQQFPLRGPAHLESPPKVNSNTEHAREHRPVQRSVSWAEPEDKQTVELLPVVIVKSSKKTKSTLPPVESDLPAEVVRPKTSVKRQTQLQGADSEDPSIKTEEDEEKERRRERRKERHKDRKEKGEKGSEKRKKRSGKDKDKKKDKKKKDKKDKRKGEKERKRHREEEKDERA